MGEPIQVVVLKTDPKDGSIALSTKRLESTPGEMVTDPKGVFERTRRIKEQGGAVDGGDDGKASGGQEEEAAVVD